MEGFHFTAIHTLTTVLNTCCGCVTSPVSGGGKVEVLVCFFSFGFGRGEVFL